MTATHPDALAPAPAEPGPAPVRGDNIEQILAGLCAQILELNRVDIDDDFFSMGGNSVAAVRLMVRVHEQFEVDLPIGVLFKAPTVRELATAIRNRTGSSLLEPIQPGGGAPPLFLVHPVGGNVLCYRDLAAGLDAGQPVIGVRSAGLRASETPLASIEDMAAAYLTVILAEYPGGVVRLGGWSMGGVIAFEMTAQLRHRDLDPGPVIMIDSVCPVTGELVPADLEDVDDGHNQRVASVISANNRALSTYKPEHSAIPVTLYRAAHSGLVSTTLGWDAVTDQVTVRELDADHYSIVKPPAVSRLARLIQDDLSLD